MITHFYTKESLNRAKELRQQSTNTEKVLWYYLKNKQLGGYRFRRQQPIGNNIVDFYCPLTRLVVELDGSQHAEEERQKYDRSREIFLRNQGITVLRIWSHLVFDNIDGVLLKIFEYVVRLNPNPGTKEEDEQILRFKEKSK